ncbi:MAG: T9SS type A sorting domain-containing protein [Crocinitomicaceae bacterium]|nr:T9SS type A sorting domain-containing protein [Crocinitomicaceae bacterium]
MKFYKALLLTSIVCGGSAFNASAQDFIYEWGHKIGGINNETGKCLTTDPDGNVLAAVEFPSTFDADPGVGVTTLTSLGGNDIALTKFDSDGILIWAKSIGGTGTDVAYSVATDEMGNVYLSGAFSGTVDFDPGAGVESKISAGGVDIFLLKLDMNGDFLWVYTNGTAMNEDGRKVAVDNTGNVYLSGYFRNTIDFDAGAGTVNLTSFGGADVFVLKLDAAGNFISVYRTGGTADDDTYDMVIDANSNVYVSGYFQGTADFDSGAGTTNLTSAGGNDIFVFKINSSGTFSWAKRIGSTGNDQGLAVAIDHDDNLVLGGYYAGTVDFDPNAGTDNKTSIGGLDLLIVKLDNSGNYIFGVTAGGISDDALWDIAIDQDNNIFSTGFIRQTVDFDPSAGIQNVTVTGSPSFADHFYWKLDEDGNYLFAEHMGGGDNDHGFAIHSVGQFIYTTGYYNGTADFDLSSSTANVASSNVDAPLIKHVNCNPIHTNDVIVACGDYTWIDGTTYTADNNTATHLVTNMYGCDSTVHLNLMIKSINDQTVTPSISTLCDDGDVTVELGSSQSGVFYSLVDQSTMTVIDGPIEANGSALTFDAGNITTTTDYEIQAERNRFNSLTFTGNGATPTYVDMGSAVNDDLKGTNVVTAEAWINTNSSASLQTVIGNYGPTIGASMQFLLRLDNSAGLKASFWVGTSPTTYSQVYGTTTIVPGTWYHIAGTWDGTNASIYVNGVLENSIPISGIMPSVPNTLKIGGGLSNGTEYFNGQITGVRVWDVTRTQTEIFDNMTECIDGGEPRLIAMYNMVDGTGNSTLTDESINGYHGTLMNMDANTSWNYTNMPAMTCSMCNLTMTQTPTVTVNYSNTGTDVEEHCASYVWIDGNTYTSSNSTATHTLTNISGCDSVVTLNLTINQPNTGTDVQNVCESLTWIDGNTYTSDNNTAQFTLTNMFGCDSVVTLNLTVGGVVATATNNGDGTMTATGSGTYQWIDCGTNSAVAGATSASFIPTANGDYAVVVTNGSCDDTSACITYNSVGLNENSSQSISVYPNPTQGNFVINLGNGFESGLLQITNSIGQVVYVQEIDGAQTLDLNLEQANGIYMVTIFSNGEVVASTRIIKQ